MYSKIKQPQLLRHCAVMASSQGNQATQIEEVKRKGTFTNKAKNKDEPTPLYKISGQEHKLLR